MGAQSGLTLFNVIATAGKTIYDVAQGVSKIETKQQLMGVYDSLMDLKRQVAELEDENYNLKSKLRFKSDDFVFKMPFWYEKANPEVPLCAKCFVDEKIAPMGEPYKGNTRTTRTCLVCKNEAIIARHEAPHQAIPHGNRWG